MKKYVIERNIPGVGGMGARDLGAACAKSNEALAELGPSIQWQHSYVAGDKTFCVYLAENEEAIRLHAQKSGFPANRITEVATMIDPTIGNPVSA